MNYKKFSPSKLFLVTLIMLGTIVGGYQVYSFTKHKKLSFDIHGLISSSDFRIDNWSKFNPKEGHFSARFPKTPEQITKSFPIPRSDKILPYYEYQCLDENRVISISYTVLPEEWLKYSSNMVLKGAMKVILSQIKGSHLIGQSTNNFKSYPSLDFEHYLGEKETAGTLILVENILYKVEMSYPTEDRDTVHSQLPQFIESFEPQVK